LLQRDLNAEAPGGTVKVGYKRVGGETLPMEIDLPGGDGPFPFVIYLHGGGTPGKTPAQFRAQSLHMAQLGVAGVRINYRGAERGPFEEILGNIMDAMAYVRANAPKHHLDLARMAWAGGSAGASLGALAAQRTPECVAFVGFNGAYDIGRHLERFGGADNLKESSFYGRLTPERIKEVSAIDQIRTPPPATLLLHGKADKTVLPEQSQRFADAVKARGGRAELRLYDGEQHGFFNDRRYDETVTDMQVFLFDVFGLEGRRAR